MPNIDQYSFAKELLEQNNYKIYAGNKRILVRPTGNSNFYNLKPYTTEIEEGIPLIDGYELIQITDYKELKRIGFYVTSQKARQQMKTFSDQKVQYHIVPNFHGFQDFGRIPKDHIVYYDKFVGTLQLMGPNAGPDMQGKLVYIEKKNNDNIENRSINMIEKSDDIIMGAIEKWIGFEDDVLNKIRIDDIPVMITNNGGVLCVCANKDPMRIGIAGATGMGKSILAHGLIDRVKAKTDYKVGNVNDALGETDTWNQQWKDSTIPKTFEDTLNLLGETTRPLPMVYLHPAKKGSMEIYHEKYVGFKYGLNWREVINKFGYFSYGISEWVTEKSGKYIREMLPSISNCKTREDIENTIKMWFSGKKDSEKQIFAYSKIFTDMWDAMICDIQHGVESRWEVINRKTDETVGTYEPFCASMLCGLTPSLVTKDIRTNFYYPNYVRFILDKIHNTQMNDPLFKKTRTLLFIDEFTSLDNRSKPTVASDKIGELFAETRMAGMELIWSTQTPQKITDRVADNTTTYFVSKFPKDEQRKIIKRDFNLSKSDVESLQSLKKMEYMAITSTNIFKIYYPDSKVETPQDEAIIGRLIPPLSQHKKNR